MRLAPVSAAVHGRLDGSHPRPDRRPGHPPRRRPRRRLGAGGPDGRGGGTAAADAGLAGVPAADSIRGSASCRGATATPHFVAERLGLNRETAMSTPGGNSPQTLVNVTAQEIQRGELELAILTGGEAWRTRMRARKADTVLEWPKLPEGTEPDRTIGHDLVMSSQDELARGLVMPVQLYPMFETALARRPVRGRRAPGPGQRSRAGFGCRRGQPVRGIQEAKSAVEIRTPGPSNRMIGLPYPKYMNSNNDVDQAAVLLLCSVERACSARRAGGPLGVPPFGCGLPRAPLRLEPLVLLRDAGRPGRRASGAGPGGRRHRRHRARRPSTPCFPSAVQLGAASLGLNGDRQLTRTGGLSFAGGPWNNYVMHAIATVVGELVDSGALGLVWANGGYVTKHSFGVYGTQPPPSGFRHAEPQAEIDAGPRAASRTAERRDRPRRGRGLHRSARSGGPAGARLCELPPGGRTAGVGHECRWRHRRRPVRRRVGRLAVTLDADGSVRL